MEDVRLMSNTGDQWKTVGACGECRRFSYCHTECPAHKRRLQRIAKAAYSEYLAKKGLAPFVEMLEEGEHK